MSMKAPENDRFTLHYEQGMLRSAFRSVFWAIISHRKKLGTFSLKHLVALLPRGDKGKVSKWFNGDPNWTINTIGTLANALNVDIHIQAVDRTTGVVYTPQGLQQPVKKTVTWTPPTPDHSGTPTATAGIPTATVVVGTPAPRTSSGSETAAAA